MQVLNRTPAWRMTCKPYTTSTPDLPNMTWKPGLPQGDVATGVGIYISLPSEQGEINIQIQASASSISTPLQAESIALVSAANITS